MIKKSKTKTSDVASFLTKTGFILEMEVAELLKKWDYQPEVNQYFLDLEENKKREIDIVATKVINKILVHLIIECKQSLYDDWIFICSDKNPHRYYYAVKHIPRISDLKKSKIFNSLHNFNRGIPLAQNYIAFQKEKGAKSSGQQVEECLLKLPKALFYIASRTRNNIKNIFLPVGLFNRQLFTASYDKKLLAKKKELIQYFINFDSKFYKAEKGIKPPTGQSEPIALIGELEDFLDPEKMEVRDIIKTAESLGNMFQIDFVTKQGFREYLKMIEKEIKEISVKKWSFNIEKARPKRLI
jgi:hypothetical protein